MVLFDVVCFVKVFVCTVAKLKWSNIWFASMNRTPSIPTPHPPSVTLYQTLNICSWLAAKYCLDRKHQFCLYQTLFARSFTLFKLVKAAFHHPRLKAIKAPLNMPPSFTFDNLHRNQELELCHISICFQEVCGILGSEKAWHLTQQLGVWCDILCKPCTRNTKHTFAFDTIRIECWDAFASIYIIHQMHHIAQCASSPNTLKFLVA